MEKRRKSASLLPVGVFLVFYLGLGILFEYIMKIPMGFYNVPIVVAFLAALLVACLQNRKVGFDEKLEIMGRGIGDKNIITMLLIFLTAGTFVGVVGRSSAESVAYFMLSIIPARFAVAVLFVVACFVSTAMGTSVGTITLLTPIAAAVSQSSGFSLALCVASVMGGSMFGDNLSFISDTTIAACNGQGCEMKDKFRENFWIAFPAAVVTLLLILMLSFQTEIQGKFLDRTSGGDRIAGSDPDQLFPGRDRNGSYARIQSDADHSVCAGAGRRDRRVQRLSGTFDRNCVRCGDHACNGAGNTV